MNKEQVETAFEENFEDPGSQKSGEYLEAHVLRTAERFVERDRSSLVEVLDEWLRERSEPRTMLAVAVAGNLHLGELRGPLLQLKADIDSGHVFMRFYGRNVSEALARLGPKPR